MLFLQGSALGVTDMRKGLDGSAMLVQEVLKQDPFSGHLFAFHGRKANPVKIVFWDAFGRSFLLPTRRRLPIRWKGSVTWMMPSRGLGSKRSCGRISRCRCDREQRRCRSATSTLCRCARCIIESFMMQGMNKAGGSGKRSIPFPRLWTCGKSRKRQEEGVVREWPQNKTW